MGQLWYQCLGSTCQHVLGQDTEPQTAPDVLVSTLHGATSIGVWMYVWIKVSCSIQKCLLNVLNVNIMHQTQNVLVIFIQMVQLLRCVISIICNYYSSKVASKQLSFLCWGCCYELLCFALYQTKGKTLTQRIVLNDLRGVFLTFIQWKKSYISNFEDSIHIDPEFSSRSKIYI